MEYYEYYIMGIVLLPAIIFSMWAQFKVNSTYKKYGKVMSQKGVLAKDVAQDILEKKGINDVVVQQVGGTLTDYYSDKDKVVALSQDIYNSASVSAIGIAMHEVGHAMQYAEGYKMVRVRNFMVRVCNISSVLLWPLVVIGLLLNLAVAGGGIAGSICLWSGIGFFGLSVIFNLVTLPVEYNASNRAMQVIKSQNLLTEDEQKGAKAVLNSAALTYVAALMVSVMNLVRFLLVVLSNSKNKD